MPLYTYNCKCGNEFEALEKMAERSSSECPQCGGVAPQGVCGSRLVTGTPIGGYYEHLSEAGVHITSKKNLRDECRAHDAYAPYVFD